MSHHPEPSSEVGVKIRAHPSLCLGYGMCRRFARDVYHLDEEGYIDFHRLDVPADLAFEAWIGASVCPQRAITVIGEPEAYWRERRERRERLAAEFGEASL